ncbi:MAG: hypothetical protein JWN00_6200 [Actinomycetia bacterium]|jgi:hypothetical protein|nr:hypothetical protein [Actinomycetes bacterium]
MNQPPMGYQGYQGYPPMPPQKSNALKIVLIIFGVILVLCVLLFAGCTMLVGTAVNQVNKQVNAQHTIKYEVTGKSSGANILYGTGGSTGQADAVSFPWTKTETVKGWTASILTITNGPNGGHTTCSIYVDGKLIQTAKADGAMGTATCTADTISSQPN